MNKLTESQKLILLEETERAKLIIEAKKSLQRSRMMLLLKNCWKWN